MTPGFVHFRCPVDLSVLALFPSYAIQPTGSFLRCRYVGPADCRLTFALSDLSRIRRTATSSFTHSSLPEIKRPDATVNPEIPPPGGRKVSC